MPTLFLLRHGPTVPPESSVPLGRMDVPPSEAAIVHWPYVREELRALGIQRVLTSDLSRASFHALDLGLPALVLPDLAEQSFGDWEGIPWAENKQADAYYADSVKGLPPKGESFAHCASRALMALQAALGGDAATLLLGHGGPLRAVLAHFLGLTLDRALDLAWQPWGLTRLELYASNRAVMKYHNRVLPGGGFAL